jgi:hypothetical protein
VGHYANECPDEATVKTSNKKGSSLLIYKNNKHDSSSDEERFDTCDMGNNLESIHTITEGSNEGKSYADSDSEDEEESTDDEDDNITYSDNDEYDGFVVLINTVDSIKNKYTVKEYSNACKARSIQDMIGRPSTKDFINYVEGNMLLNCPINKSDILRAEEILGPNLGSLKGKTTRKTPSRVHIQALDDLPDNLLQQHKNVTLTVDIM